MPHTFFPIFLSSLFNPYNTFTLLKPMSSIFQAPKPTVYTMHPLTLFQVCIPLNPTVISCDLPSWNLQTLWNASELAAAVYKHAQDNLAIYRHYFDFIKSLPYTSSYQKKYFEHQAYNAFRRAYKHNKEAYTHAKLLLEDQTCALLAYIAREYFPEYLLIFHNCKSADLRP